jgi:hypothetical protein
MIDTLAAGEGLLVPLGYVAAFFGGVVFALFLGGLGRAVFGLLRPVLSLARRIGRFAGLKTAAHTRPARAAAPALRRPDHLTAIEWALRQPDVAPEGQSAPALYDLKTENAILRRQGQFFKWLRIPAEYIPKALSDPFTEDVAASYLEDARRFLADRVELHANHTNFYEDEEGAIIASLFRASDRRCFHALDQLRRIINSNALRLIAWLSVVAAQISIAAAMAVSEAPKAHAAWGPLGLAAVYGGLGAGAALFLGGTFLIQAFYANQQRQNMREFSDFLTRYLSLISNRFREASATASRVIQGDERDSKRLAAGAQKWHKIMIWLGLRPFFIESFVRNVNFQMRRNLSYYNLGALLWFGVVLPVALLNGVSLSQSAGLLAEGAGPLIALALAYAAFAIVSLWQVQRRVVFEELNQRNWLGFDNLEVGRQIDEVIGKYAEDIGLWKGRFDR